MNTTTNNGLPFFGTDASNEISLFEYGLLVKQYLKDGREDEYFVVYGIERDDEGNFKSFGTGYITEEQVNGYVLGKEFMKGDDIDSFLSFAGSTEGEWLRHKFILKLSDLLQYSGPENIIGTDYNPIPADRARELYLSENHI